ncbi:hypothetical protein ACICHK_00905 [Streptomyces sp. AHU1]|uniref:hypothetical protein n=1 Tax=Streptomyces sp. AHU1 TaxID=3377215 RepID=UPI003877CED6
MGMNEAARTEWWKSLLTGIRDEIDGYVLQDSLLIAVKVITEIGLVPHDIGVGSVQLIANDRYLHYGDRVARRPESLLDLDSLACRAAGCGGRVVAVEAIWNGDIVHDWFVRVLAISAGPVGEVHMATVHWSTAKRYLGEDDDHHPRRPAAVAAERAGRALAAHLSVPFRFAGPDPRRRAPAPAALNDDRCPLASRLLRASSGVNRRTGSACGPAR